MPSESRSAGVIEADAEALATRRYLDSSRVSDDGRALRLATWNPTLADAHPHFFEGRLRKPRLASELLTAVHAVVSSRFFVPANTLEKVLAAADPVVTLGDGVLRFEGFSACCSAYVRVDLLPSSYDGDVVGKGTTNVDFNAPMRAALARVRDAGGLALSVGGDALELRSHADHVVEKKVDLPVRWLRSMVEVQSFQAAMSRRFEVSGVEALRFLRSLPRASTSKTPLWVSLGPHGLRSNTRESPGAVRIVEVTRVRALEPLLPRARSLTLYADDADQSVAWVLSFEGARLTLVLSAETWRGFSGEGRALRAMMTSRPDPRVRASLSWQSRIVASELAEELDRPAAQIEDALRVLGASGLVGFDVSEGAYFHRVLPLDLGLLEELNPRLVSALELIDDGAVSLHEGAALSASVRSDGATHAVRASGEGLRCTCPWYAKHGELRGPCKHVLAVEGVLSGRRARDSKVPA